MKPPKYGNVLIDLINTRKYTTMAEVGVYQAKTSQRVYLNCPSITEYRMIDPWVVYTEQGSGVIGKTTTEEIWEQNYQWVCETFKDIDHFHIHRTTSVEGAKLFPDKYFDVVMIDAIHSYERVKEDIQAWQNKVKKGGVLMGDDVGWAGVYEGVCEMLGENNFYIVNNLVWIHDIE